MYRTKQIGLAVEVLDTVCDFKLYFVESFIKSYMHSSFTPLIK